MSTHPSFSSMLSKGDNFHDFLFAYLEYEVFPKGIYSYRKEFVPVGANSFLEELTLNERGGKNENKKELLLLKVSLFTLIAFLNSQTQHILRLCACYDFMPPR